MRILAAALLAALAIGAARPPKPDPRGEAELARLIAGRVAGRPADCISFDPTDDATVIDHTAIVYHQGGQLWVNRPVSGLENLDDNSVLVTELHTSQLCSVDIVNLIDRSSRFPRGFLGLGKFVPYAKPRNAG